MKSNHVDTILTATFLDERLSRTERKALKTDMLTGEISIGEIPFWRHRAFVLARQWILESSGDPERISAVIEWLEGVCKVLVSPEPQQRVAEAHFSPGQACLRRLSELIGEAKRTLAICVFTITDDRLTEAIIRAEERGVDIRIISDDLKAEDRGSDLKRLVRAGLSVRFDDSRHHMHHKFMVVDEALVATGSYNWTRSAERHNQENILVSDEPKLVASYLSAFNELWNRFD